MSGSSEPQLGIPRLLKLPRYISMPVLHVAAGGTHCLLIDSDHNVWTWGYGLLGN